MPDERAALEQPGPEIPAKYSWARLAADDMEGAKLEAHYRDPSGSVPDPWCKGEHWGVHPKFPERASARRTAVRRVRTGSTGL